MSYQEDMQYTGLSVPTVSVSGTNGAVNPYNLSTDYSFAAKHDGTLFFPATNGGTLSGPGPADSTNTEAAYYAPLSQLAVNLANPNYNRQVQPHHPGPVQRHAHRVARQLHLQRHAYPNTNPGGSLNDQEAVAQGDNFLSMIIPQIMNSNAWKQNNDDAIVISFDETEGGRLEVHYHPGRDRHLAAGQGQRLRQHPDLHPLFRPEESAGTLWRVRARWRVPGRCEYSAHE